MKNIISILIILSILLSSCFTQRKAVRQLNKIIEHHPELIKESIDTFIIVAEVIKEVPVRADTLEASWDWDWEQQDTFHQVAQDSFVRTEVRIIRDTIFKVSVRTEVFPDTIEIIVNDTIQKIVFKTEYVTKLEPRMNKAELAAFIASLILMTIAIVNKKKKNDSTQSQK
jgi:hypothetical protein